MEWYQSTFTHFSNDDYPLYNLWKTPIFYFIDNNSSNDERSNPKSDESVPDIISSSESLSSKTESGTKSKVPQKVMKLSPSSFVNGCVCGHHIIYRDVICEPRKKISNGIAIRPKIPPTKVKLKLIN